MMESLEYTFEDLGLVTDLGFQFAPVNGVAEISYDSDGSWAITDISLEGFKILRTGRIEHKTASLCRKSYPWLYSAIVDALETHRASSIDEKVFNELSEQGVSFKTEHDHQRSEFMAGVM